MVSCAQETLPGSFQLLPASPDSAHTWGKLESQPSGTGALPNLIPRTLAPRSQFSALTPPAVTRRDISHLAEPHQVPRVLLSWLRSKTVPGNLCQAPASSKVSTPPLASSPPKPARTLKSQLREALSPKSKSARPLHQRVLGRGGRHVPSDAKGATRSLSSQSQSETGTEGERTTFQAAVY